VIGATILGVAVRGPGLDGWAASRPILSGAQPWDERPTVLPPPAVLAPTERRRTGPVARLALALAHEAVAASGLEPASLRSVFGTANGDGITVGAVLDALTQPDAFVSPTLFHNSVHNAPAGYWSIGAGSQRPATSLGGHDWTFGVSLMKALTECSIECEPVLLCVYDVSFPAPLDAKRATGPAFGMALVLAPEGTGTRIEIGWNAAPAPHTEPRAMALRQVAPGNPAARALRLLESLARGEADAFAIPLLDGHLTVTVHP
jgi:hypothetical protein